MKYGEAKRQLKKLGLTFDWGMIDTLFIRDIDGEKVASVSFEKPYQMDTSYRGFSDNANQHEIASIVFELAMTPLLEREPETKYIVRIKSLGNIPLKLLKKGFEISDFDRNTYLAENNQEGLPFTENINESKRFKSRSEASDNVRFISSIINYEIKEITEEE